MNEAFQVQFFSYTERQPPDAGVATFPDGVGIARYFLENFEKVDEAGFTIAVVGKERGPGWPTLHVERTPSVGVLVQLFMPEALSPAHEDGWYILMEPRYHDLFSESDISTTWESGGRPDMVESHLSQGAMFSRKLYVPVGMAIEAVDSLLETGDLPAGLANQPWKFVGLI
jgi:hypothetical protein